MRSFVLGLSLLLTLGDTAWACSAFATQVNGERAVAKNFDWFSGEGFLVVNQRGRERQPFLPVGKAWTSKYGSVSFTIIGPGFPVSGMNEKGLVVESLVNHSASAVAGSGQLASLEWVQFALDRFGSVKELRLALREHAPSQMVIPLHFFACDAGGDCMVVEPDGGRLEVIAGRDLAVPVLANRNWRTDYRDARAHADSLWQQLVTPGYQSHARYSSIYRAISDDKDMSREAVFEVLDDARMTTLNRWQLVWHQESKQVSFRIHDDERDGQMRSLAFDQVGFTCGAKERVKTLASDNKKWRAYTGNDRDLVAARVRELVRARRGVAPRGFANAVADHTQSSQCARRSASR